MAQPIGPKIFEVTHVTTEKGNGCSYLQKLAFTNFDMIVKEPVKSFVGMFRKMKISLYDN